MAAKAQIIISLSQHLRINRAVRLMTGGTSLSHGFVLKKHLLRLLPMASGAGFVSSRHGESAPGLHHIAPVRIVALDAVHVTLGHRMMLR